MPQNLDRRTISSGLGIEHSLVNKIQPVFICHLLQEQCDIERQSDVWFSLTWPRDMGSVSCSLATETKQTTKPWHLKRSMEFQMPNAVLKFDLQLVSWRLACWQALVPCDHVGFAIHFRLSHLESLLNQC